MADTRKYMLCRLLLVFFTALSVNVMADIKTRGFQMVTTPITSGGPIRVGGAWLEGSRASCIITCLVMFPPCPSAMYNDETGLCTPGSWLRPNQNPPSSAEGNLYLSYNCGPFPQFQAYASGSTIACLALISTSRNYTDADFHCKSLGANYFVANPVEKMKLLPQFIMYSTWIGLDDIQEEEKFIWRGDGSEFNMTYKDLVFDVGEPNGLAGIENCVHVLGNTCKGNDAPCDLPFPSVCEKPFEFNLS